MSDSSVCVCRGHRQISTTEENLPCPFCSVWAVNAPRPPASVEPPAPRSVPTKRAQIDGKGLAYLIRRAARRLREETHCEYCSPGGGCHVCGSVAVIA